MKILIVEDDFLVAETIAETITDLGYIVADRVDSGEKALDVICDLEPDLVMMDVNLPGMDGLEATEKIIEKCPLPVILLTAYESEKYLERAKKTGIGAYLVKPADKSQIERAIAIASARFDDLMELKKKNEELEKALAEIKTLSELLPICSVCKKIRNEKGSWKEVEEYISENTDTVFSHGICPDCISKIYPDYEISE